MAVTGRNQNASESDPACLLFDCVLTGQSDTGGHATPANRMVAKLAQESIINFHSKEDAKHC